jgi:hypothetical protein
MTEGTGRVVTVCIPEIVWDHTITAYSSFLASNSFTI